MARNNPYAWDLLRQAISEMAESTEPIRERVAGAKFYRLFKLMPNHFPASLLGVFEELKQALPEVKPPTQANLIGVPADYTEDDAVEAAKLMTSLFHSLELHDPKFDAT